MRNTTIACWTALSLLSCAPGGPASQLRPDDPTVAGTMGSSCLVPEDYGNPLIVDWNPEQRGNLEVAMKQGVVVVAYDCNTLRVLPDCSIPSSYGFMGMNRKEQLIRLENADEIKANLPTTGAKLGGGLERGSALDVALVMVGKMMTTRKTVGRDALEGACGGATHFVRGATIGAFAARTGTKAKVASAAQLFGAGAEASSSSTKTMVNRDGDLDACKGSTPSATEPPQECSALLRLNLAAISPANTAIESDSGIQEAHEQCPDGFRFDGAKCTRLASGDAYQCRPNELNDCLAQCRVGHAGSCNNAGTSFFRGDGVRQDLAKAAQLFSKSCAGGFGLACFNLGYMQVEGVGIKQDVEAARRSFTASCDAGEAAGCSELGWMKVGGIGMEPDYEAGRKLFVDACVDGFPSGCVNLAYMYSAGLGVKKDYERALAFNAQACDGGGPGGCAALALMYTRGWGIAPDEKAAYDLYKRACDGGSATGCNGLGLAYVNGKGTKKDIARATELFTWACEAGSKDGCFDLGLMMSGGIEGGTRDDAVAAAAFDKGCQLGHAMACSELGFAFLEGRGVAKDQRRGVSFIERGCQGGDKKACDALKKMR